MIFGNGKPKAPDFKTLGAALVRGYGAGQQGNRPGAARPAGAPGAAAPKKGCACTGKKVVPRLPR